MPLAGVEGAESPNLHLLAGPQSPNDAVKYRANDEIRLLQWQTGVLANRFGQSGPVHSEHPDCITQKSITVFLFAQDAGIFKTVSTEKVGMSESNGVRFAGAASPHTLMSVRKGSGPVGAAALPQVEPALFI